MEGDYLMDEHENIYDMELNKLEFEESEEEILDDYSDDMQ